MPRQAEHKEGGLDELGSMVLPPPPPPRKKRRKKQPPALSTLNMLMMELQSSGRSVHQLADDASTSSTSCTPVSTARSPTPSSKEPPAPSGFWESTKSLLKVIGMLCRIICPPMPSRIVRKVAFHPPPKGTGYTIRLDNDPSRVLSSVAEVGDEPFSIVPVPMVGLTLADYDCVYDRITASRVLSASGNDILVLRIRTYAPSNDETTTKQVILMTQPNSSDLGHFLQPHCVSFAHIADALQVDIYAFDYSGFGYSSGYSTEKSMYADVMAAFNFIRETRPDMKIVMFGYSIGTAAAVDLAASLDRNSPLTGLILMAPFTSGVRLLTSSPNSTSMCCYDVFKNSDKIANVDVPILIIHGTQDTMVPLAHTLALRTRIRHAVEPCIVVGADHQTIFSINPITFNRMSRFLSTETLVAGGGSISAQPTVGVKETSSESTACREIQVGSGDG